MSALLVAAAIVAGEWIGRRKLRRRTWKLANERAAAVGKPLLVIGDPAGGATVGDYGYGDVCGDITGCPGAPNGIYLDINERLPFDDNSHVVFCSFTLEQSRDVEASYRELVRVAGDVDDLFSLSTGSYEVAAYTYPGARWVIDAAPPYSRELRYRALGDRSEVLAMRTR